MDRYQPTRRVFQAMTKAQQAGKSGRRGFIRIEIVGWTPRADADGDMLATLNEAIDFILPSHAIAFPVREVVVKDGLGETLAEAG